MLLESQVALITGSGRGIGRTMAQLFAKEGAAVFLTARTEKELSTTAAEIVQADGRAEYFAGNIVHRDIKPGNIIITKDNSARIVDFGLARVVATTSATMTGGITGTLPYMSPEQILGESVNQRCDVWARAILLVQMVSGSHPFARESSTAMTFPILNQPPSAQRLWSAGDKSRRLTSATSNELRG